MKDILGSPLFNFHNYYECMSYLPGISRYIGFDSSVSFTKMQRSFVMNRCSDNSSYVHFRTHRIIRIDNCWYFLLRDGEGMNMGPYESKEEAEESLEIFMCTFKLERDESDSIE